MNGYDGYENYFSADTSDSVQRPLYLIDRLSIKDILDACKDPDEYLEFILTSLFISLNEGSLCLNLSSGPIARKASSSNTENAEHAMKMFVDNLYTGKYADIISVEGNEYKPLVFKKHEGAAYLYFQKYFHYATRLKDTIRKFLSIEKHPERVITPDIIPVLNEESVADGRTFRLNQKQKLAVISALMHNFTIISGGPGTGKTAILSSLLRCLIKTGINHDRIALVSPTGRAAQKMTHSIRNAVAKNPDMTVEEKKYFEKLEGSTLHRLLKFDPRKGSFVHNEGNKLDIDAVVVDEVSMVDMILMSELFDALDDGCKIILIGDKDQLPSVDAGAVLAGLIPDERECFEQRFVDMIEGVIPDFKPGISGKTSLLDNRVVILDQNYRTSNSVFEAASKINKRIKTDDDIEDIMDYFVPVQVKSNGLVITGDRKGKNTFFIDAEGNDYHGMKNLVSVFFGKYFSVKDDGNYVDLLKKASNLDLTGVEGETSGNILRAVFETVDRLKILTVVRDGLYGCSFINDCFKELLFEKIGGDFGYPVIMTHNDYSRKLFNGDVGIVLKDRSGAKKVVFRDFTDFKVFEYEFFKNNEAGFSITIHKSQGSEYNDVLIVLPENKENTLLTKEIIYTACTRAKRNCFIFGTREVFTESLKNFVDRESGIGFY
jgi:exodeoxyribonuclease V alpha subunit